MSVTKITIDDVTRYVIAKDAEIERLKALFTRAADALERPETRAYMQQWVESLIAELRKAAQ